MPQGREPDAAGGVVVRGAPVEGRQNPAAEADDRADQDAALVARVRAGDNRAFDALFQTHYSRVYNFVVRLHGSSEAEDIAQLVFVRAYRALPGLREGRTFLKYLYRIAVNLVRDRARTARRKPWMALADLFGSAGGAAGQGAQSEEQSHEMARPELDPERIVAAREMAGALREQIAALPLEFREALVLHHIEGVPVREIAEVLGVPEGTVKSRLGRARARLAQTMAPWVAGGEDA